jgi:hypothetical protein
MPVSLATAKLYAGYLRISNAEGFFNTSYVGCSYFLLIESVAMVTAAMTTRRTILVITRKTSV